MGIMSAVLYALITSGVTQEPTCSWWTCGLCPNQALPRARTTLVRFLFFAFMMGVNTDPNDTRSVFL